MRLPLVIAALLTIPLAACGSAETGEPGGSSATPAVTEAPLVTERSADTPAPAALPMMAPVQADVTTCGADKLGRWLNALPTADVKAQISATVGDRPIRYYAQGDAITMDYSEARLNVELGADGRIKLFRCG